MKLLLAGPSPFARKVVVTLHETDQLNAVEQVTVAANPIDTPAELAAANPVGKIPALVRDDGPTLYDSRVITQFLNARAGGSLYPEARKWETLTLEATGDGITDAAVSMIYEGRFREDPSESWIEGQWTKVTRGLDAINTRWMSHLHGKLDIGHIAVACALGYIDFRLPDRDWRTGRDALAAWEKTFLQRPSMQATIPQG